MTKINIIKPFVLTRPDGEQQQFAIGVHEVEDDIANHWFVKPHTGPMSAGETVTPASNPVDEVAELRERLAAAEARADEAEAALAKAKTDAEAFAAVSMKAIETAENAQAEALARAEAAEASLAALQSGDADKTTKKK